jgi:hypothetical protein
MSRNVTFFAMAMFAVTGLGTAARISHLHHPMRYDESYNYLHFVVQGPVYVATHYLPNNHILHTLCVWATGALAGHSPAALRLPALAAGILLIPATGLLAWMISRRASVVLLSALGVAASSALIEYSANARGYSMLALLAVAAACLLLWALAKPARRTRWLWWGAAGAAGLYTVPVMALPLAGMGVYALAAALRASDRSARRAIGRGLACGTAFCLGLAFLAYLPVLVVGGVDAFANSRRMAYDVLGEQIASTGPMIEAAWSLWMRHAAASLPFFVLAAVGLYLRPWVRGGGTGRGLLPAVVAASLLLAAVAGAPLPARTWIFGLPFLLIMVAAGVGDRLTDAAGRKASLAACAAQVALAAALLAGGMRAWASEELVSEPGGLALVEPALAECVRFGAERCAVVAPFTPAMGYYRALHEAPPLAGPDSTAVERVLIVTNSSRSLDDLWRPGVAGYGSFGQPELIWQKSGGAIYVAERVVQSW